MKRDFDSRFAISVTGLNRSTWRIALFWVSGVIYDANSVHVEWIRQVLLFNPVTLIANGYRNCFIYKQWFWETPGEMRNYLIVYVVMILLAIWAYKKLHKDIPDVL